MERQIMDLIVEANTNEETAEEKPFNFFLINQRHRYWLDDNKQIRVGDHEVMFPTPEKIGQEDLALAAIRQLKERQEKVMADAHKSVAQIEEQISRLNLITYQPKSADE